MTCFTFQTTYLNTFRQEHYPSFIFAHGLHYRVSPPILPHLLLRWSHRTSHGPKSLKDPSHLNASHHPYIITFTELRIQNTALLSFPRSLWPFASLWMLSCTGTNLPL